MAFAWKIDRAIDKTKVGGSVVNFPFVVDITHAGLKDVAHGGHVQSAFGYDIAASPDNGATRWKHQLVFYDPATGHVILRARAPSANTLADVPYQLVYGDPSITTDQSDALTWDAGFQLAFPLSDGTTLSATDVSGNGRNGTLVGPPSASTGQVDGGAGFTGTEYISAPAAATTYPLTLEAWVKLANTSFSALEERIVLSVANASGLEEFWLGYFHDGVSVGLRSVVQSVLGSSTRARTLNPTIDTSWHHVAVVFWDASTHVVYFDGGPLPGSYQATGSGTPTPSGIDTTFVGGLIYNSVNLYGAMVGTIDEPRVSNVTRDDAWILTTFNAEGSPSTFSTGTTESALTTTATFTAEQGSFTLTGEATAITAIARIAAAEGAFTLNGQAALIRGARTLTAAEGAFTLTGESVTAAALRRIVAAQGSFALIGQSLAFVATHSFALARGLFTLTGEPATIAPVTLFAAAAGTFTLSGETVSFVASHRFTGALGAFTLTGEPMLFTVPSLLIYRVIGPLHNLRTGVTLTNRLAAVALTNRMPGVSLANARPSIVLTREESSDV